MKRYVKFYLNYWIVYIIFVPLGVFCFGRGLSVPYGDNVNLAVSLFKDFLGIQGFHSYNVTWWFNRTIILLWLFFPVFYFFVKRRLTAFVLVGILKVFSQRESLAFVFGICLAMYRCSLAAFVRKTSELKVVSLFLLWMFLLCFNRELLFIHRLAGVNADSYIALLFGSIAAVVSRHLHYNMPIIAYLGKHSMNMYMVHTFIFFYFFHDFIYGFKYPLLIFFVLLMLSLSISIMLEFLKKKLKFYVLINRIINKLSF